MLKNARLELGVCLSVGLSITHWCISRACYIGQGFELGRIYFPKKIPSGIVSVWSGMNNVGCGCIKRVDKPGFCIFVLFLGSKDPLLLLRDIN